MAKTKRKELILWGFHPKIGLPPIRLEDYRFHVQTARRRADGWVCAVYAKDDEPLGLIEQYKQFKGE